MAKLMLMPNNKEFDYECDAYLIGISGLSVNMPIYFSLDEIKNLDFSKEIFISLNKNIHSDDLALLEDTLKVLNDLDITGIFFYDNGVFNMAKRLNLDINLVYAQEHMGTNHETLNFWHDRGINYALLSEEISENEIIGIRNNTNIKLILPIFGYFPMFVSRRHLVKNYLDYFNLNDDSSINYISKEGKIYPIVDSDVTTVYTSSYLNGIKEYVDFSKNGIDYVLINSFLVSDSNIRKILSMFKSVDDGNKDEYFDSINNILDHNIDTFFLHKESIYKVK